MMARLFVQYLAIYNNKNLSKLPKCKKLRQIWSHFSHYKAWLSLQLAQMETIKY